MQSEDKIPADVRSTLDAINKKERKGYGFAGRLLCFISVLIAVGTLSLAPYVPFVIGASMSAGNGAANSIQSFIPFFGFCFIVISGVLIFKK